MDRYSDSSSSDRMVGTVAGVKFENVGADQSFNSIWTNNVDDLSLCLNFCQEIQGNKGNRILKRNCQPSLAKRTIEIRHHRLGDLPNIWIAKPLSWKYLQRNT